MARGLVLSGARARFTIDGVKVMYATNVSYSEEIQQDPVEVLDQLEVAEFVATAYRCTLSAQFVRVINNPIKNRDGVSIFPKLADIIGAPELVCTLEDNITGVILASVTGVKAQRYTANHGTKAIVLTDTEFVAIRVVDESELV